MKDEFDEWMKREEKSSIERKITIVNGFSQALSAALNKQVKLTMLDDKAVSIAVNGEVVETYSINLDGPLAVFNDTYMACAKKGLLNY
jgi:hypothetical protein